VSLSPTAVRVLGALLEKEHTTPESYPLSLNALVIACNQKTSRNPVTAYSEREVEEALQGLRDRGLVTSAQGVGERVVKHQHLLHEAFSLSQPDFAVLAVLMLRGPQTAGELRSRTERYTYFPNIAAVEASLEQLAEHRPLLARAEARAPGQSQTRWVHLLGANPEKQKPRVRPSPLPVETDHPTLKALQEEIETLKRQVARLLEHVGLEEDI
jgi:uncharacterized protein YceH (UPF0502 family)